MMAQSIKIMAVFLTLISTLHADTIYKSIDESGRISYSSTPPENEHAASEVTITPPPSDEQIQAAQELREQRIRTGEMLEENRIKRNEATAEENRLKRENQQQSIQNNESTDDQHYGYPYIPGRNPGRPMILPPAQRPILPR